MSDSRGIHHIGYPVWAWHWGNADDLPWSQARALHLDDDDTERKRKAIACHTTNAARLERLTQFGTPASMGAG